MNSSKSNAYIDFIFINWEVCRYRVQNTYMYGMYPKYYYFHCCCCCCCWIGAKKKATSPVLSVCLAKFPTLIILPTTTHLLIKLIYLPLTTHVGPQQLQRSQTVYICVCLHLRSRVPDQLVLSLSKGKVIYIQIIMPASLFLFYFLFY